MHRADEVTPGPWEWRGDQLFSPSAQMTLLRDVKFWNLTDSDKKVLAAGAEMLEALKAAAIILRSRDRRHDEELVFRAVQIAIGKATN